MGNLITVNADWLALGALENRKSGSGTKARERYKQILNIVRRNVEQDFQHLRFTARDKEILGIISDVLLEHCRQGKTSNRTLPEDVEISEGDALRLLDLLQDLVKDPSFIRRASFAEAVAKDNSIGSWKLAKLYFANSRGLGRRSTPQNVELEWQLFARIYSNIGFHEFLAREGELLRQMDLHPEVVQLLINLAFKFEPVMDNSSFRNKYSRKGTIVRAIGKTTKELEDRLAVPRFRGWVTKTRLVGAAYIVADVGAIFGGAQLSAIGVISGLGGAVVNLLAPDSLGRRVET